MRSGKSPTSFSATVCFATAIAAWMISSAACAAGPAPKLTGADEVPPVNTTASAYTTIRIGADGTVSGGLETSNIDGTKAHIHQGATGSNGPVLVTLEKISPSQWIVPADTKFTPAQIKSFQGGEMYVNVHSATHPDGEIRLQLH
jgi:CHRD domain-containing protein